MRVISGTARGRRLHPPKDQRVRPTSDRVKEALFNILTVLVSNFQDTNVLDIFAGTGNLGIEALSRGASTAVFIDNHRESTSLILKNLEICGFATRARIVGKEAVTALKLLERKGEKYQLVFMDPPYEKGLAAETLNFLSTSPLIDHTTAIAVEMSVREKCPAVFGRLHQFDRRVYGDTAISFYRIEEGKLPAEEEPPSAGNQE